MTILWLDDTTESTGEEIDWSEWNQLKSEVLRLKGAEKKEHWGYMIVTDQYD